MAQRVKDRLAAVGIDHLDVSLRGRIATVEILAVPAYSVDPKNVLPEYLEERLAPVFKRLITARPTGCSVRRTSNIPDANGRDALAGVFSAQGVEGFTLSLIKAGFVAVFILEQPCGRILSGASGNQLELGGI